MITLVNRDVEELGESHEANASDFVRTRPIEEFDASAAYVLLGDPGMGKTTAFASTANRCGSKVISVADFICGVPLTGRRTDAPVFIDALDGVRASTSDGASVMQQIRVRLQREGITSFRLSCREFSWFGDVDANKLRQLIPAENSFHILRLQKLDASDIRFILERNFAVGNADAFVQTAADYNLEPLPIEAKKNNHRELWTAVKSQLIKKYCIDPKSGGLGLYLVFWFGDEHCTKLDGWRPSSARELGKELLGRVPQSEKPKISVRVVDVSNALG